MENKKNRYTVNFFKLSEHGYNQSDGIIIIHGYDEVYETDNYDQAIDEYEDRKQQVTATNNIGVTMSTWAGEIEIDQINHTSEDVDD